MKRFWPLVYLPVPIAGTWASLGRKGWPINHEYYAHFERVEAFRRAYDAGDFFPLWTSFAEQGHGSALPFFYHRLFNTIGSVFAYATGSTYAAVKISVYLVMLLGLWGMDRTVAAVGGGRLHRFSAACLLVFSNYSLTDWLVRGSTAEFTAFMLLPWVYLYLLRIATERRGGVGLGTTMALLFYAHSAVFYFVFLTVAGYLVVHAAWTFWRREDGRQLVRPLVQAAIACAVIAGPYAFAVGVVGREFTLSEIHRMWSPLRNMRPLWHYFYDPSFDWGHQWRSLSVEIGRAPVIALLVLGASTIAVRLRPAPRITAILVSGFLFCLWLQTPLARPFYRSFPGAMYLGFPWRLLCVMTLIVILFAAHLSALLDRAGQRARILGRIALGGAALFQFWFALSAQTVSYGRYTKQQIQQRMDRLDIPTVGEYLPKAVGNLRNVPPPRAFITSNGCARVETTPPVGSANVHVRRIDVSVTSAGGCTVSFNQFANVFLEVTSQQGATAGTAPDHTIQVHVPPGTVQFTLSERALPAVVFEQFRKILGNR